MLLQRFVITIRFLVLCHILLATNTLFCNCSSFTRDSCDTFRPTGASRVQPVDNAPFAASTSSTFYIPSQPVQITISDTTSQTTTFQGIFLQARVEGSTTPIGSFDQQNGYTYLDCGGDPEGTLITRGTANRRGPVTFTWNPPANSVGHIIFIIDIEVRSGVYWWFTIWIDARIIQNCNGANPCANGGECNLESDGALYCTCPSPFTGPLCTDCISTPCDTQQRCRFDSFCYPDSCEEGYACHSIRSSQCAACGDAPCLNEGTCVYDVLQPRSFRCECAPGFQGITCNHAVERLERPQLYQLPPNIDALVNNGQVDCIILNGINAVTSVRIITITGYLYSYGTGNPMQNPEKANNVLTLQGSIFWFCLKVIDSTTNFILSIQ